MGVRHDVDQHLVELVPVRPQHRQVLRQAARDLDVIGAQLVGQQLHRLLHHLVEPHLASRRRLLARQRQKVSHDAKAAVCGGHDLPGAHDDPGLLR